MRRSLTTLATLAACAGPAFAEVSRFEIQGTPTPAFGGREFGTVGRYERIAARATIAVDPADPRNAVITDIALAPRNAEGRVEAVAEVVILRPAEPVRGNGTLLLEVPNRGRELIGQLMNDTAGANRLLPGTEPGNGFLMRQGYTMVWVGWQADLAAGAGLRLDAPVGARRHRGLARGVPVRPSAQPGRRFAHLPGSEHRGRNAHCARTFGGSAPAPARPHLPLPG